MTDKQKIKRLQYEVDLLKFTLRTVIGYEESKARHLEYYQQKIARIPRWIEDAKEVLQKLEAKENG